MKIIGVIRSLGERTEGFSEELLSEQVDKVFLVKNVEPLKSMVIECLKIGIDSGADYMITNDADVFILPGMVEVMLKHIKKHKCLMVTGKTFDKFLGVRDGGIRIFDCTKLKEPIEGIKNFKGTMLRPEAYISRTYGGIRVTDITSLHEFEQYYVDIYKRYVFQSIKSKKSGSIISDFEVTNDIDFKVAHQGFFDEEKDFKKSFPDLIEKDRLNDLSEIQGIMKNKSTINNPIKISVFTSSYNYSTYLKQAIESVLNQTYVNFEYILIDDGSTDNTYEIMKEYENNEHVKIIRMEKQSNLGAVLNKSIEISTGDYWSWCPADDYWDSHLLEKKVQYIEKYPKSVLFNSHYYVDLKNNVFKTRDFNEISSERFSKAIWKSCPIAFTGIFIPMYVFKEQKILFPEHLPALEDFYWTMNAVVNGIPFNYVPHKLHYKRKGHSTLSKRHGKDIPKLVEEIRSEFKLKL